MSDGPGFAGRVVAWQALHGRHDLPWQNPATPYRVWVSEIMLQQTQVATVVPYFERFMARFPALPALARAPLDDVLGLWSGLGYYARARNLHAAAGLALREHGGELPAEPAALTALPGIGRSTAGAILALGFGIPAPILDGNVRRVLARHRAVAGWPGDGAVARRLWTLAETLLPDGHSRAYAQGLMDLGATVCTARRPRCELCPLAADCAARAAGNPAAYPPPRPHRVVAHRPVQLLVLREARGAVLLERRPPAGIWGGLWSLPEYAGTEHELVAHCRDRFGLHTGPVVTLPTRRHTLTHLHLSLTPLLVAVEAGAAVLEGGTQLWYNPVTDPPPGLPAPIRRLLADLSAPPAAATTRPA